MTLIQFITAIIGLCVTAYVLITLIFAVPRKSYTCPCGVCDYIIGRECQCDQCRCTAEDFDTGQCVETEGHLGVHVDDCGVLIGVEEE